MKKKYSYSEYQTGLNKKWAIGGIVFLSNSAIVAYKIYLAESATGIKSFAYCNYCDRKDFSMRKLCSSSMSPRHTRTRNGLWNMHVF